MDDPDLFKKITGTDSIRASVAAPTPENSEPISGDDEGVAVAQHLESISRDFVHALNTHSFDPNTPAYSHLSKDWVAVAGLSWPVDRHLPEYLASWRLIADEHPDLVGHIKDQTTDIDHRGGRAEVFNNITITGAPVGHERKVVLVFEFRRQEGRHGQWLFRSLKGVQGMD